MKRRTRDKVGNWPNMRDDTLRAICDELIRARKKHPQRGAHEALLRSYADELREAFANYKLERSSAMQIYALAAAVAAMAIRVLEEGTNGSQYAGNTVAPDFVLEP